MGGLRKQQIASRQRHLPRESCREVGCDNPTAERKPYCIEHLDKNSTYIQKLKTELEQMGVK